mmetsp:Transcript_17111/g.69335  ORF Transcript_17111/g.69335 Transcript_17111/m.69335 type:complete len:280 (-) Transcript_17111:292-1131(-)
MSGFPFGWLRRPLGELFFFAFAETGHVCIDTGRLSLLLQSLPFVPRFASVLWSHALSGRNARMSVRGDMTSIQWTLFCGQYQNCSFHSRLQIWALSSSDVQGFPPQSHLTAPSRQMMLSPVHVSYRLSHPASESFYLSVCGPRCFVFSSARRYQNPEFQALLRQSPQLQTFQQFRFSRTGGQACTDDRFACFSGTFRNDNLQAHLVPPNCENQLSKSPLPSDSLYFKSEKTKCVESCPAAGPVRLEPELSQAYPQDQFPVSIPKTRDPDQIMIHVLTLG